MTASTMRGWPLGAMLLALAATTTPVLAQNASAPAAKPSGTLTIAWPWDPGTMDPQMHRQRYTQIISHAMRDKLYFQPPPGLALAPLLAESVTQIDDTHYDVKIKQGVHFHNGDELTAEDVAYTFERLWDPAIKSPRRSMGNMTNIEGVKVIDRYTVRWTTKVPFGPPDDAVVGFHFSGQEMLHKATYEKLTMEQAAAGNVMGVGPFKFVEWVPDQRVVMDAFEDYWQGTPGVERIIWRTIPEEATRVAELLAGSVDMIYPVTPDFVPQMRAAGMKLEVVAGAATRMLMMNVREGSPFHDPEVRKAMNMAIDKDAIVEHIYQGLALPYEQISGVGQDGFIEGYDPFPYDPEAARPILSKITQPIELSVQPQWEIAAEAIAEQLRGYGMNVKAVVLDTAAHTKLNEDGAFDLTFAGAGYGSGDFTGAYYNNHFECVRLETKRVRTGFCEPSLDAKMTAVRAESDPVARKAKLDEVVKLLSEEYVPWVPLFGEAEVWAMQPYVDGFRGSTAGQMFDMWKVKLDR
jgi:peptide/nickel transport system substrate-binding protein